jgi:hypothetical protein
MHAMPQISLSDLPEPRPSMIDLGGDYYITNPAERGGDVERAVIEKMLAKTPDERIRWNECWKQAVRQWLRQGYTPDIIANMVWGETAPDDLR